MILSLLVVIIYILNFLVIINLIFRERRQIQSTIAWLLILSIVPMAGFFLYLIFGRKISKDNLFKTKKEYDIGFNEAFEQSFRNSNSKSEQEARIIYENKDMISTLLRMDNAHLTSGNKVDLYKASEDFFDTLLYKLERATNFINIQFYIFKDDEIGTKILKILTDKAKSGVEVRLLYDALGSRTLKNKSLREFRKSGGKVAVFFPSLFKLINLNLNYRNHRKIVVIDGEVGFIGGFNVGDEYLGKNTKFGKWRDTHIQLQGLSVDTLNLRFLMDWSYASRETLHFSKYMRKVREIKGDEHIQIVSSGPDSDTTAIKYGYIKMIQKAKKYVYIQTPYLILDESLLDALHLAKLSGIDVRVMIPSKPDHPFIYWATYSYAGELLKLGAKIYIYDKNAFLHAKTVVIDDSVCSIGTANMDIRSFALNFEVNAFIYSNEVSAMQRKIFEEDIIKSEELTLEKYNNRSKIIKAKESISRLLSPVL